MADLPIFERMPTGIPEGLAARATAQLPQTVDRELFADILIAAAGDPMMVSVLLRLKPSGILGAYVARGETRPACKRAFASQLGFSPPASGLAD
jgi:glutathione S-transferase